MNLLPTGLELVATDLLQIAWSDGEVRRYTVGELRKNCPCASCREQRQAPPTPSTSLPVISLEEAQPLRITQMEPTGRYAYAIHFSDGHNTGLFTLESLRELGTVVNEASQFEGKA